MCRNISFSTSFQTKKPFEDIPSGLKISFYPYSDALSPQTLLVDETKKEVSGF